MTVQEFKAQFPDLAHLEGEALWNAMEDSMMSSVIPMDEETFPLRKECPLESYRFLILDVSKG